MARWLAVLIVPLLFGCTVKVFDGVRMPPEVRAGGTFFVKHQPNDGRALDKTIRIALRSHGAHVTMSADKPHDYVVSYVDNWWWDWRTFLTDFRIDVRDRETNILLGTARSFQDTNAAKGHTYREIVRETVAALFDGFESTRRPRNKKRQPNGQPPASPRL